MIPSTAVDRQSIILTQALVFTVSSLLLGRIAALASDSDLLLHTA